MERLYDFEEECAEGLMQQKEDESMKKTDVRVKSVLDMMEEVRSKMEDLERWENMTQESNQTMEDRLQRMEEIAQHTSSQLSVIHRFMASQIGSESNAGDTSNLSDANSEGKYETDNLRPSNDLRYAKEEEDKIAEVQRQIVPKGGLVDEESTDLISVEQSILPHPTLPHTILIPPSKEWIKDARALATSTTNKDLDGSNLVEEISEHISCLDPTQITEQEQSGVKIHISETNEVEGVRFQIEKDEVEEKEEEKDQITNTFPLYFPTSVSPITNRDLVKSPFTKSVLSKVNQKQKRKLSKASSGKPECVSEQILGEKECFGSADKKRHISNESRGSMDIRAGTTSILAEEKPFRRRARQLTESSAGGRTSEEENQLLSQHSARRRASRMEHAMVGKVLGRQKRISDAHEVTTEHHPKKRLATSKDSNDGDIKEQQSSGRNYYRSQSEVTSGGVNKINVHAPRDSHTSHSEDEITDSSESAIENAKQRLAIFPIKRKMNTRKPRRDYTSITDALEQMICVTPNTRSESKSPRPDIPAIKIEAKCLHDAEETDYNMMETLIEQRLRRDSHNLVASLEDLVTKSIRDESSTSSSSSSSTSSISPDDPDSESDYSDPSKRHQDIPHKESCEEEPLPKNSETRKKSRKSSYSLQRNITLASKQAAASVVPAIKKYSTKSFSKSEKLKKRSSSKISLASLEIVEQQLAIATAVCSSSGGDIARKELNESEKESPFNNAGTPINTDLVPK